MFNYILSAVVTGFSFAGFVVSKDAPVFYQFYNDMEDHWKSGTQYNRTKFDTLLSCMAEDDDLLVESHEATYRKIMDFYKTNGTTGDTWGELKEFPWLRQTPALFGNNKFLVFEPCNYVSNMAYYHSVTRTCDYPNWSITQSQKKGLKRVNSVLSIGSAMMHASHTKVGKAFDDNMIGFVAIACYDIITQNFPGESPILKQLSLHQKNTTFEDVTTDLLTALRDTEVEDWIGAMNNADIPNFKIVFSALVCVGMALLFPWFITERLITWAIHSFPQMPQDIVDFILIDYMPVLKDSVDSIHISYDDKKLLAARIFSIIMKAIWSFIFQEDLFHLPAIQNYWFPMWVAAHLMPVWNRIANHVSGFSQTDYDFNHAVSVYPGDYYCRIYSPHAMWHEESAGLLFDFSLIADYANQIILKSRNTK